MIIRSQSLALFLLAVPFAAWALTDDIDLPFKDDPPVVGRWQSVAFVRSPEEFNPQNGVAAGGLFLKDEVFLPEGRTPNPRQSWTQGVLINSSSKTASRYTFKKIGGLTYMFLEWKSGDYAIRNQLPFYYVLIREADFTKVPKPKADEEDAAVAKSSDCLVAVPPGGICKHPLPERMLARVLNSLPRYDASSEKMWQVDLRGEDASNLSVSVSTDDLMHASFDTKTRFPKELPGDFAPEKILELGKNPGLKVRDLHRAGITGKGVSIAIIDQALLVDHEQYAKRLKSYEEIHWLGPEASMHAGAVSSIAVGKDCGVAPGADLYFVADKFWITSSVMNYRFLAKAIDRVVAFNKALPKNKKIRALAIARGFQPFETGYAELTQAVRRAKKAGIFVITSSLEEQYGFRFNGLGRSPLADPDEAASYGPGIFWQRDFFSGIGASSQTLLVPMDSRSTVSQVGQKDYVFYREGGWSWSIPYIAGLYALACQVQPGITPEIFWKKALETGDLVNVKREGKEYRLERVVNPEKLILGLKETVN